MQCTPLRMGSQEGPVLERFGQLALKASPKRPAGSRVFFPPAILHNMPTGSPVELQLAKIQDILKNECKPKLNQLFQYLHQKLAPMGSIDAEHKKKHAELIELDTKIKEVWDKARGIFSHIPFMHNLDGQSKALSCMLEIEMQVSQLRDASKNLGGLLHSEARNIALEYYKKTINECEKLSSLATQEDKIRELHTLVDRVLRESSGRGSPEVYEIHDSIYLYLQYAVRSFRREIPATDTAAIHRLTQLDIRLKEKLFQQLVPDLDGKDPKSENPKAPENLCIAAAKAVVLPTENTFRNAPWTSMFTTLPVFGRYSQISTQIGALEGIAKALISLESQFQERISNMSRTYLGNEEQFAKFAAAVACDLQACRGLERLVDVQVRSLSLVPLAPELHAGWNYASAVRVQAKVLASIIRLFEQDMTRFGLLTRAVNMLKCPQPGQANKATTLWQTTRAVCDLAAILTEDSSVFHVVSQTLTQNALDALRMTKEEQQLPKLVAQPVQAVSGVTEDLLVSYLKKGFLRYLHFPVADVRAINLEFEKTFYTLKYDPAYKAVFDTCLHRYDEFRQLHDVYIGQHEKVYALLIKYQFNTDQTLHAEIDFGIYKLVNEPAFEQKALVGIVKPLLYRWVLERFAVYCKQPKAEGFFGGVFDVFNPERIDLSYGEQNLLTKVFAEYRSDPIEKKFWDSQYPAGEMERALKEFDLQFPLEK